MTNVPDDDDTEYCDVCDDVYAIGSLTVCCGQALCAACLSEHAATSESDDDDD